MANTINDLISGLQQYVVQPINTFGLAGFVFDVATESMATLSADITDHYTEDNKALQDHIAIRPKRITLKGFVGELVYTGNDGASTPFIQTVAQKLTTLDAFLPRLSAAAVQGQEALNTVTGTNGSLDSLASSVPAAANLYGIVKNSIGTFGNTAKQQAAYQYFASCQSQAILMSIQTPWEFLTNMAIETIVAIQPEESIYITDFAITFKQIRIAKTLTAVSLLTGTGGIPPIGGAIEQGAAALQGQAQTDNGVCSGVSMPCPVPVLNVPAQAAMVDGNSFKNSNIAPNFSYPNNQVIP